MLPGLWVRRGRPLVRSATSDTGARRLIDQCIDEYSISQAMSEMDEADMRANNAIQTAQNVMQEIKDIALDSASGRGNLEWIVGDAVAHLAVEFSKNRDPAADEVDDDELALERVQSKEWFRILKRKLSADGISATDRAGRKGFLSKVWVLKNMCVETSRFYLFD